MDDRLVHELLSGRRSDPGAVLLRASLVVASWGYSAAMRLRNAAYDRHWFATNRAPVPVISLGNITTGGTGKTPLAAWLANWFIAQGCRPGLLSRGYRSLKTQSSTATFQGNDEKLVLDRLCPGVPHLQQRDRVQSALQIVKECGCNVLILDDGYQHRRLHRDLDLVLIDALQPWGYRHVLPRGLLREPADGIRRADLVVITRADQLPEPERHRLTNEIAALRKSTDVVEVAFVPQRLIGLDGTTMPIDGLKDMRVTAFSGIGNPAGFRRTLASLGVDIEPGIFPDHHHYQPSDLESMRQIANTASASVVLTTLKDLVKISSSTWKGPPLYAVDIGVRFLSGHDLLIDRLQRVIDTQPSLQAP